MATRDEREDVTRQLACLARLVFARAGPPGFAEETVCFTGAKGGIEEVIELVSIDSDSITIIFSGLTPMGREAHVSTKDGFEALRFEVKPRELQTASAEQHLCLAAS